MSPQLPYPARIISAVVFGLLSINSLGQDKKSAIEVHVLNLSEEPIAGIVLEGKDGRSFPSSTAGWATLPSTAGNELVALEIFSPKHVYLFISPYNKQITRANPEVMLAKPGERRILQSGPGIVAITASIISRTDREARREVRFPSRPAIDAAEEVARGYGFDKEEADSAIRAWKKKTRNAREKALIDLYEKRYAQSAEFFLHSLAQDSKDLEAQKLKVFQDAFFGGVSEYHLKNYKVAALAFQKAIDVDVKNKAALESSAATLVKLHQYDNAETIYKQRLALGDVDADMLVEIADVLEKQGKIDEAEKLLTEACNETEDDMEPERNIGYYEEFGDFLERHGRYDDAAEQFAVIFRKQLHPREFPLRGSDFTLERVVEIRKRQGLKPTAEEICSFVLKGQDEEEETVSFITENIRTILKEASAKESERAK